MKSMVVVWTCDDDQALGLGKEERETKWAQGKGDIHRAILFLVIETLWRV
jgi:hypothetical protein